MNILKYTLEFTENELFDLCWGLLSLIDSRCG